MERNTLYRDRKEREKWDEKKGGGGGEAEIFINREEENIH